MYSNNRSVYRQAFYIAWEKHCKKLSLEPLEMQMITVMLEHSEYHALFNSSASQEQEFSLEENPFFHLSLHMAVRDQIKLDRPPGIKALYQQLLQKNLSTHEIEHHIMQCLAKLMWQGTTALDEQKYLQMIRKILPS